MADDERLREYLKRVVVDLHDTRSRLGAIEARNHEPVAIIGMACRFPGGVRSRSDLWGLLDARGDAIAPFPLDRRWEMWPTEVGDLERTGLRFAKEGGFVYDAPDFDAAFFGIRPREALAMDPQQRLLLETSWEAIEDACVDPLSLKRSDTGVFIGATEQDYLRLAREALPLGLGGYVGVGNAASVLSGRVAYGLGLEGPALTVNTACSSSLVALHLACRSLRTRECSLALVGGVTVLCTPIAFAGIASLGGLAHDGRCKPFADAADGIGVGEGVGVLALESLSDARRAGRNVLAVIRGSAVNQDGTSNGLTAPSGLSQQRVIARALDDAGLSSVQIDAVEAHGTGTPLGDQIEAQALLAAYGRDRDVERPLFVGSIKSNIGHTQGASGMAGVIKMVEAMSHGTLPATLHTERVAERIDWSTGALALLREAQPWQDAGEPRRAGVSSFGISGTNAHVILEQAPVDRNDSRRSASTESEMDSARVLDTKVTPWVLSARHDGALRGQALRLRGYVAGHQNLDPRDVGHALRKRAALERRAVVLGDSQQHRLDLLSALASHELVSGIAEGVSTVGEGGLTFVFPGQDSQTAEMITGLSCSSVVFAKRMRDCDRVFAPLLGWSIEDVVRGKSGSPPFDRIDVLQPVRFANMVSLAALWSACGVNPTAVVGHSQGEIAAACVAGCLSLEDAARVVVTRSRSLQTLVGRGRIISVAAPFVDVSAMLDAWKGRLYITAVNSPRLTSVGGEESALDELVSSLGSKGIEIREIAATVASHTPQVDDLRVGMLAGLEEIAPLPTSVEFCSTVTGSFLATNELTAAYWYRNLREPVRFEGATRELLARGHRVFIEVSPRPLLTVAIEETIDEAHDGDARTDVPPAVVLGSLRRAQYGVERFIASVGEAWASGVEVDWAAVLGGGRARHVDLPTYEFQRSRYWMEPSAGGVDPVLAGAMRTTDEECASGSDAELWGCVASGDAQGVAGLLGLSGEQELASLSLLLPALSRWRQGGWRGIARDATTGTRYRIAWKALGGLRPHLHGRWLLVLPARFAEDPWVIRVASTLRTYGADLDLLAVDCRSLEDNQLAFADLREKLECLRARHQPSAAERGLAGIVSLLALDERLVEAQSSITGGLAGSASLVDALDALELAVPTWFVTRQASSMVISDSLANPLQALVTGLSRVLSLERPAHRGGVVDLPGEFNDSCARHLCCALAGASGEEQLAVRSAGVFARRLLHTGGDGPPEDDWHARDTAMIVGASEEIAAHIARWLARSGAGHLLLVDRHVRRASTIALQRELRSMGVEIDLVTCDACDRGHLAEVFATIPRERPLDVVVQVVGGPRESVPGSSLIDRLRPALKHHCTVARNLHELTAGMDLSGFLIVCPFDTVAATAAHSDRCPAHAYLHALIEHRRSMALPAALAVLGEWPDAREEARGDVACGEYRVCDTEAEATIASLQSAMDSGEVCRIIANLHWRERATKALSGEPPLTSVLVEAGTSGGSVPSNGATHVPTWQRMSSREEREREALELVRVCAAAVLGCASAELLADSRSFKELGFNSLMSVELRNRLQAATGLRLPLKAILGDSTLQNLAGRLSEVDEFSGRPQGNPHTTDAPTNRR